jgi:nitrous oxidase accessory protein NosD
LALDLKKVEPMISTGYRIRRLLFAGVAAVAVGGAGLAVASAASAAALPALYASPSATSSAAGTSCSTANFSTISAAVASATSGDTVVACPGTYAEDVVITIPLTLVGESATINATGLRGAPTGTILGQAPYNGITIESSNVTVEGFKVVGAKGEGILAVNPNPVPGPVVGGRQLYTGTPLSGITIENNVVKDNDRGFNKASSPYLPCTPNGGEDCGEGIHLMSVEDSLVRGNQSVGNSGGILLTDEYGPTHGNVVSRNYVVGNTRDCGITLPGHNLAFNPETGQLDPTFGGVYDNLVARNVVMGNGVEGFGAGVGIFAPQTFTASYDNTVSSNLIEGNGLAGISVHSHQANAYVNDNVFTDNTIGANNVDLADGADPPGPADKQTTGILVWSAATTYDVTIKGNTIFDDTYGVWYTPNTVSIKANSNSFSVTTKFFAA